MWSTKEKTPRFQRQPKKKEDTKPAITIRNFDAQDDVYVVNATNLGSDLLAVRYSNDSNVLVAGGALGTLLTLQPNTHEVLGTFQHPQSGTLENPITSIREYPPARGAGCMITTSATGYVQCWDIIGGELKFSLKELRQSLGLAVSSENFITTGDDGILHVYDIATTDLIAKLEPSIESGRADGHSTRSFAAAFNPSNTKEAISGGWDDCVHFWDVRQKHSLRRVGPAHICGSDALDFSPDGKEILAGSYQRTGQMQIWEYATGSLIRSLQTDRFQTSLYAALYLSDTVVCAGGSDPHLFRAVNIQQKATIALVKDMSAGVTSIHKTGVKLKIPAKPTLNKGRDRPNGKSGIPRVAFSAGQYLFEIEFY